MIRITNTMTRTKEEFVPLASGEVRMYVCGVTVYDYSHIGHARSAMVFDVIRRYFTFKGYRVTFVKNYTDIDDRIIKRANDAGVTAREFAERFIAAEREDMASLGVLAPDVDPKATEHVGEMIRLIEQLVASGHAYPIEGDVYFGIRSFPRTGGCPGKISTSSWPAPASRWTSASATRAISRSGRARSPASQRGTAHGGQGRPGLAHRVLRDGDEVPRRDASIFTAAARISSSRTTSARSPRPRLAPASRSRATGRTTAWSTWARRRCRSRSATR